MEGEGRAYGAHPMPWLPGWCFLQRADPRTFGQSGSQFVEDTDDESGGEVCACAACSGQSESWLNLTPTFPA